MSQTQAIWYIDYVNGNDANTGLSAGAAIKTQAEWAARTLQKPLVPMTIIFLTDSPEDMNWDVYNTYSELLTIRGTRSSSVFSGTMDSIQNWNPSSSLDGRATVPQVPTSITASDLVGKLCVHTATGYTFWCAKDLGSKRMRFSYVANTDIDTWDFSVTSPAEDAAFTAHTQTKLTGLHNISVRGHGAAVIFYDLELGDSSVGAHQTLVNEGAPFFVACKLYGFDPQAASRPYTYGCWNSHTSGARVYERAIYNDFASYFPYGIYMHGGTFQPEYSVLGGQLYLSAECVLNAQGSMSVFDTATAIKAAPMASIVADALLWGTGTTMGIELDSGARLVYSVRPAITAGTGGQIIVGSASKFWTQLPYVDTTTQAFAVSN